MEAAGAYRFSGSDGMMESKETTRANSDNHGRKKGALSIRDVTKVYDPDGVNVIALDNCSLEINAGEFVAVVGPSGCGKTTLLNIIAGFDSLTSGEIRLDGEPLAATGLNPKPGPDRVVVFQHGALFPWKTVLENVIYGPVIQGKMTKEDAIEVGRERLSRVGLREIENTYPSQLSSGMQRRVEIVRALINNPQVLLLDEPFRGMDSVTKSASHEYLLELYGIFHTTIYFITHDLEEAIFLSDTVAVMTTRPGRIRLTIDVDLPRPRNYRMLSTMRFIELKERAQEAVHEEAMKAFHRGERELA